MRQAPIVFALLLALLLPCGAGAQDEMSLGQVVELVLKANPALKARDEQVAYAREDALAANRARWASLSLSYRYARLNEQPYFRFREVPGSPRFPYSDEDNAEWTVEVFQPLFTGFALISKEKMAALEVDAEEIERRQDVLELSLQAKEAYFHLLLARRGVEVAEEAVRSLEAHERDASGFFKQGLIPYNDLLRSKVALAAARQRLTSAKARLEAARDRLNVLMARPVGTPLSLEEIGDGTRSLPSLQALTEAALEHRPERKALALRMEQARLMARIARSKRLPQIGLVARYQQMGEDLLATENDYTNPRNSLVALEARWELFQWGRTSHEIEKARHKEKELAYVLQGLDSKIAYQVKRAWLGVKVAEENVSTARTALDQAKENYRITNLQYREHMVPSSDVLDARQFLSEAETNYYKALYGYRISIARLERAVGVSLDAIDKSEGQGRVGRETVDAR